MTSVAEESEEKQVDQARTEQEDRLSETTHKKRERVKRSKSERSSRIRG